MTVYTHWRDVPKTAWRWPNFSPAEIACRGTGKLLVNEAALDKLQALRLRLGKPLIVLSAYRSPEHNRAVGGARASKHMQGIAFDIAMANHDPEAFELQHRVRRSGELVEGVDPRGQRADSVPTKTAILPPCGSNLTISPTAIHAVHGALALQQPYSATGLTTATDSTPFLTVALARSPRVMDHSFSKTASTSQTSTPKIVGNHDRI